MVNLYDNSVRKTIGGMNICGMSHHRTSVCSVQQSVGWDLVWLVNNLAHMGYIYRAFIKSGKPFDNIYIYIYISFIVQQHLLQYLKMTGTFNILTLG